MRRYWTPERVIEGLQLAMGEIKGKLPCLDSAYNEIKKGRSDLPPAMRILEYHHSIARGWLAAGAPKWRVSLRNVDWSPEEDDYLLEKAGKKKLASIAKDLRRSYAAVKTRLNKHHKLKAKENQGFVSAAGLSKLYNCPYHRVRDALASGVIKGSYDSKRNMWKVDLKKLTPEAKRLLEAPKVRSYKNRPPDLGDYDQRYGIKRTRINGKVVRVERSELATV